jgi:hypothetical protein
MFWIQAGFSFALWIGLGWRLARLQPEIRGRIFRFSRAKRIAIGCGLLVGCLAFLFFPLDLAMRMGGFQSASMSPLVWLVVTLSGLLFVGCNTIAMGFLVSVAREVAVTERNPSTSTNQDPDS